MRIHLDERKPAISLEPRLNDITEVGEQGHEVILSGVGGQVADIASRLPRRGLVHDHVVAMDSMGGEVVVAVRGRWRHAHRLHCLLLRDRRLSLLVRPVTADRTRAKPLAVHRAEGLLRFTTVSERHESIATGPSGLHIPHDPSFRYGAERREGLKKDLVVDLV